MNYAYIDKYGVLHVTGDGQTARKESKDGTYIETDTPNRGGYPEVNGEMIVVYGTDECYAGGNRSDKNLNSMDTEKEFPRLAKLYRELM